MNGHAIRPSAWWFALPAAVLVIGAVAFVVVLVGGLGIAFGSFAAAVISAVIIFVQRQRKKVRPAVPQGG